MLTHDKKFWAEFENFPNFGLRAAIFHLIFGDRVTCSSTVYIYTVYRPNLENLSCLAPDQWMQDSLIKKTSGMIQSKGLKTVTAKGILSVGNYSIEKKWNIIWMLYIY